MSGIKLCLLVITLLVVYATCQQPTAPKKSRFDLARDRLRNKVNIFLENRRNQPSTSSTVPPTTTQGPTTTHMNEGVTTALTPDGGIVREPLKRSQVNRVKVAIRKLVNDNRTPAGHHPFNAGILRLSFHDCVGMLGCDGCINHLNRANSGVAFYAKALDKLWDLQFKHAMTLADFYSLAGITVVEYAMELNTDCQGEGCRPKIDFFYGRHDCGVPQFFLHTFCPIHHEAAPFFMEQFNLNKTDYTVLMGAHTLGRVNTVDGDTFDRTPDKFDNNYFIQLASKTNKWRLANRTSVPELNESWVTADGSLLMLGSDIAIISNISMLENCSPDPMGPNCPAEITRERVESLASDNKLFLQEFVRVYGRVVHKSPFRLHKVVEDVPWGPRYLRPGTLPTFAPTTTTTTTTTTTLRPIVAGTALHGVTGSIFHGSAFCQFDGGVLCPFIEQMTNDQLDMQIVSGYQSHYGPFGAKLGSYFLMQRANTGTQGKKAWIKIKQFTGVAGCLHLYKYQAGDDSGSITVYRAYGGLYPGNPIRSTDSSSITRDWEYAQYSLPKYGPAPYLSHELIIEVKMGASGVIALDDIIFDDRQSC